MLVLREDFPRGKYKLHIEETTLKLRDYRRFLAEHRESIGAHKARQQAAFEAVRERWRANGQLTFEPDVQSTPDSATESAIPAGHTAIVSPVTGSLWQTNASVGQRIAEGEELAVLEAMKMEVPILADLSGEIVEVRCERGRPVVTGDVLFVVRTK